MTANQAKRRLDKALVTARNPDGLNRKHLMEILKTNGFVCVRGMCAPGKVRTAKAKLRRGFDASLDSPAVGEKPQAVMRPFQKITAAGVPPWNGQQYGRKVKVLYFPRFYRTIYLPMWSEDHYGMHELFRAACWVRNVMYGLPRDYCIDTVEDGWWSATRIHQYPRGGGFLVPHRDQSLPRLQREARFAGFYQAFVILSKKGEDFECGGGFFDIGTERFFYEGVCELGDIVVFDQRRTHGVEDVDPHRKMDLTRLNGRLAGFASFYKDLR